MSVADVRERVRFGVVGTGVMAASTARILTACSESTVTAISSRTRTSADRLTEEIATLSGERVASYDDYREMFASGQCDAVAIMTPDDLHADPTIAAAQAGLHVLVEKPFSTSVADADRMVAAIRTANVHGMCLYTHRWIAAMAQAKEHLDSLGAPICAYARKHDTINVPTEMLRWAGRTTCAWFLSGHDIDLVTWLFGSRIREVTAVARRGLLASRGIDTPDVMSIQARFENNAIATFESGWVYPTTFPATVDSYLSVVAERGTIHVDRQREGILVAGPDAYSYPRHMIDFPVHGVPQGSYPAGIQHFVRCVMSDTQPFSTIESARDVTAVLSAVHIAEQTGASVAVDYSPSTTLT